jgi:hypothetical protein
MNRKLFLSLAAAALALAPVASFAEDKAAAPLTVNPSTQKGMAAGGRVEQAIATVTAVDATARTVTLKGKTDTETIKVGPEVKNFDQIKVGDRVKVTFSQGVVLSLMAPDAKAVEPSATAVGEAAAKGEKPAGAVKVSVKGTVTISKIDAASRIVTLTGPEGRSYKVKAGPDIKLDKIKVGDKVLAEYSETVAIAVEPAPAAKKKAK